MSKQKFATMIPYTDKDIGKVLSVDKDGSLGFKPGVTRVLFVDGSAMQPGMIQCQNMDAVGINEIFANANVQPYLFERTIMGTSPLKSVFCTGYSVDRASGNTYLHFGEGYADIIVNPANNTITLQTIEN